MPSDRARTWTLRSIARTRKTVATVVAAVCKDMPAAARLRYAAGQVMLLREEPSELQQLVRFFHALYALDHHAAHGGLQDRHVHQLAEVAAAILARHGVHPGASRLDFLHGELLDAASAIEARAGRPLRAAIAQIQANHAARGSAPAARHGSRMLLAARSLRLGDAAAAARCLADPWLHPPSEAMALLQSAALRLGGAPDAAAVVAAQVPGTAAVWECLKAASQGDGDPTRLVRAVRRDAPHYAALYLLEATLFARAGERLVTHDILPRLSTLVRRRELDWSSVEGLKRCARTLEAATDPNSPVGTRLLAVAGMLETTDALATLEHEMLVWAAAGRWLARMNAFDLAGLALRRYRALCWSASEGRSPDCLRVAGDLLEKPWFRC